MPSKISRSDRAHPLESQSGVIVLRVSEIFLKKGNRNFFVKQFRKNARRLIHGTGAKLEAMYLRDIVHYPPGQRQAVIDRLHRLFGLHSMSPAFLVAPSIDSITAEAIRQAKALPSGTFKVKTNRRNKRFPLPSMSVSSEVGGQILKQLGRAVDIHRPDHTIHIEIGDTRSFIYTEHIPGPGGLPVATAGRVGLLLSGGIDSPVAGYSALRRGCLLSGIYFHSFPYTGDKTKEKVVELAAKLAAYQRSLHLHIVDFTDVQKKLREHGPGDLAVLLYRRMMMRTANKIATTNHLSALVTGENLGQVASQTIENIRVIEDASSLPILRPLLCKDKSDIVEIAQKIDTFETSILPYDDCCSLFVPKHPATRATIDQLTTAELGLNVDTMAQELATNAETIAVTGH